MGEAGEAIDSAAELAAADRWQYAQAFATWERFRRGEGRTVPREEIDRIFRVVREGLSPKLKDA